MKDVGGAVLAGSTPPFLWRERAAVDVVFQEVTLSKVRIHPKVFFFEFATRLPVLRLPRADCAAHAVHGLVHSARGRHGIAAAVASNGL